MMRRRSRVLAALLGLGLAIANAAPVTLVNPGFESVKPGLRGDPEGWTGSYTGGGAVLTLQAMRGGAPIAYNHMTAAPVKGTTDWTRHEITLAIPATADQIEVGAMLHGPGTMWIDDVALEVVEG